MFRVRGLGSFGLGLGFRILCLGFWGLRDLVAGSRLVSESHTIKVLRDKGA